MREKTLKNRGLSLLLAIVILVTTSIIPGSSVTAATSSKIKIYNFIKLVVQATGLEVESTYLDAALKAGIIKDGDFSDYSKYTTRTDAAVILNRADEYLNDIKLDADLIKTVLTERISDISKIAQDKREAVAKIYAKGFMKGYSNGYYIKSREFRGSEYMTTAGAKGVVAMLKDTKKRAKLSPDGQLIRTTNLPKNAKQYDYILETYPNSFYEMKFRYQRVTYSYEPKELVDYASPVRIKDIDFKGEDMEDVLDKYYATWIEKVKLNIETRLNADYRSIDKNNTWLNNLRSTYPIYNSDYDKKLTKPILNYIIAMKKNKVIVQSKVIAIEPSTLYSSSPSFYLRVYVKFKITANDINVNQDELVYGNIIHFNNLKKNQWIEGVYDIGLDTINGSSNGSDYSVSTYGDSLNDYFYKGKLGD